jgi:pimeloyl-ACP methyl ester carboxylesterase
VKSLPFADNNGVRIHYEIEGKGPQLLLVHGLFDNLERWYESGYVNYLKKDYQLVLMDMRGHGTSDKPHNPDMYRFELLAADPVAVLDKLHIRKANFLGYSMGGRIGFGVAKYASNRFNSFILGGTTPSDINQALTYSCLRTLRWAHARQILRRRKNAIIAYVKKELRMKTTPYVEAQWVTNDIEALEAFLTGSQWGKGLEKVLQTMKMPCLIYCGEGDDNYSGAKQCAEIMPNATFVSIPSIGHIETLLRSDLVLPHITKFLEKVSRM